MMAFRRMLFLYCCIAFVVLIPVMTNKVIAMHIPKVVLLICIPGYCILAAGFFQLFKSAKSK
jgi:hypothetical protein